MSDAQQQPQQYDQNQMMAMMGQMMAGQMPIGGMNMPAMMVKPKALLVRMHAQTPMGNAHAFVEFEVPETFQPQMIPMVLNQLHMSGWPVQIYDGYRKRNASNGYQQRGGYGNQY